MDKGALPSRPLPLQESPFLIFLNEPTYTCSALKNKTIKLTQEKLLGLGKNIWQSNQEAKGSLATQNLHHTQKILKTKSEGLLPKVQEKGRGWGCTSEVPVQCEDSQTRFKFP